MSDKKETLEKVSAIVDTVLGFASDEITLESNIENDLGADSLDKVELIIKCEKAFDIQISDEKAESVQTIGDMVNLIDSILEKQ